MKASERAEIEITEKDKNIGVRVAADTHDQESRTAQQARREKCKRRKRKKIVLDT